MKDTLTYNTARKDVIIPAYGRNIQALLEKAVTLEHERQQAFVERIIQMMLQTQSKDENMTKEDLEKKLWKHAYRMAEYKLSAVPPDGHIPSQNDEAFKPEEVPYPKSVTKQKNYGEYVLKLINKAIECSDEERKKNITNTIACYMKLAYSNYNDAQSINDQTIASDLLKLSNGQLVLDPEANLDAFMGKGSQSHIKQSAPTTRRSKRNRRKGGGRNRRRFRKK